MSSFNDEVFEATTHRIVNKLYKLMNNALRILNLYKNDELGEAWLEIIHDRAEVRLLISEYDLLEKCITSLINKARTNDNE